MELIQHPFVSESTAKTLMQFGWKNGDPIPAELGQKLIGMKEGIAKPSDNTVVVAAVDLTETQLQEIKALLDEAKEVDKKQKEEARIAEATKAMSPTVAAEYRRMQQMTSSNQSAEIVDDRAEVAAQEQNVAVEEKPAEQSPAPGFDTPPLQHNYCPRCGWDTALPHDVKISDADKEDFLISVLGNTRFKKTYELFGGKMVVHFRSVTAEENEQIYRQIALDQQSGVIETRGEWVIKLLNYRMACALEKVTTSDGKILHAFDELDTTKKDKDQTTILPAYDKMAATVLAQEATRRLLGVHLREFSRLTEALEAMALEPSFWNGID
jgi:hypothetical protein